MDANATLVLLQVVKESMAFPQLKLIHNEALKQLAVINASLAPAPAAVPSAKRSIPTHGTTA